MKPTRRQVLRWIGVGTAISQLGIPATATETERVFVHPETGLLGDVLGAVDAVGGTVEREYDNFSFVLAEIPEGTIDELRSGPGVAFIERDSDVGVPSEWTPSVLDLLDPGDNADCSTHPSQRPSWGYERIGADEVEPDGSGVDIGILDTGIETGHCTLNVAGGRNFTDSVRPDDYEDRHGHGTHVAGVASALDNDLGVAGVAPNANLYAVKVLDDNGSGRYSTLVAGIDWCMSNGVELISMSLGGESSSSTVDEAIEKAHSEGHLLICAAGNNGNDGAESCSEETMTYPATHEDVIAVSAMDEDDSLASYSSVGSAIDLLAPGTAINSTYIDNTYAEASGTSIACPFVTGVAALVWQGRTDESNRNEVVRSILSETAEDVLEACAEGNGLVDARAAVSSEGSGGSDGGPVSDDPSPERENGNGNGEPVGQGDDSESQSVLERFGGFIQRFLEYLQRIFQ